MIGTSRRCARILGCLWAAIGLTIAAAPSSGAQTIIDEWNSVKVPPAPELKSVTVDPKTTALLILDIAKQTCNQERRPRCLPTVPRIQTLLNRARAKGVSVIYSLGAGSTIADVFKEVAPQAGEPAVLSGPDKFLGTELEKILKDKGIQTVIIVGTAAHGAILYTASEAALRGFKVIVPVDGVSADIPYAEQYVAWNMLNAPRVGAQSTLTKIDLIQFP